MSAPGPTQMSRRTAGVLAAAVLLLLLALVVGWAVTQRGPGASEPGSGAAADAPSADAEPTEPGPPSPSPSPEPVELTILSAGDVLPHDSVLAAAHRGGEDYDFVPLMAGVEEWTGGADLALCSLEVPIAPPGTPPAGYPVFGAPEELAHDLAALGWDGCATATNHAMDRGMAGLTHTLDVLDEAGLGHVGTARTPEEAEEPQLYTVRREDREVVVAHLSATTLENIATPAEAPWAVETADVDRLVDQAARARAEGADVVVVSMHWGVEYVHGPVAEQVEIAEALADSGEVDLVLGGHSHVPQPIDRLPGGPHGEGMWVAYSMGNLISNQGEHCCTMETATGVMTLATLRSEGDGSARVTGVEWTAVTVDHAAGHQIYPLTGAPWAEPTATLDEATVERRRARALEVMGAERERQEPPTSSGPPPQVASRGPSGR